MSWSRLPILCLTVVLGVLTMAVALVRVRPGYTTGRAIADTSLS
jgi:hypothetical protein